MLLLYKLLKVLDGKEKESSTSTEVRCKSSRRRMVACEKEEEDTYM